MTGSKWRHANILIRTGLKNKPKCLWAKRFNAKFIQIIKRDWHESLIAKYFFNFL